MFVQVIEGRVTDARQVGQLLDEWMEQHAPDAAGWLGSTAGVTEDGTFLAMARFESADAARRNSGRAKQGEWWARLSKLFTGEAVFHDCSEVDVVREGSDEAGFVQVIRGRTTDVTRLRELNRTMRDRLPVARPDVLGAVFGFHDGEDGAFTQTVWFSSEQEAREAERKELPPEAAELMREAGELMQDLRFHDLREPWLYSPR